MPGHPFKQGNNFFINIACDSVEEIDKFFAALGEKGTVIMTLQETFWAKQYAVVTDQFGIPWEINCGDH